MKKRHVIIALLVLLFIGSLFTNAPYQYLTAHTLESVRIKDKQISTETDKDSGKVISTYLIYTDHGVFRNDDAGWHLKYNSSDFYGDLDVGKRYRLKVYGWRIPLFSMYPNIVRMKELPTRARDEAAEDEAG
ncbi:MAG: hypothetical protein C0436_02485 [Alphaproteobacteria bacterium]|nr:hypothetical protein [Alphaproteobacteria bacterium]